MVSKWEIKIFTSDTWNVDVQVNFENETVWLDVYQIADIFWKDRTTIQRHIKKIYSLWELDEEATCAKKAQVQVEWGRSVKRDKNLYNLDLILAVWYKTNSERASQFRKWSSTLIKEHLVKWYTVNKNLLQNKKETYLKALDDIKALSRDSKYIWNNDILELIKSFSSTWFNLESYDKQSLPEWWFTKKDIQVSADDLYNEIEVLKIELIRKKEATQLFAQEKQSWALEWIIWSVFQTLFWEDAYKTIEEKAAHLLYFIIKNHPFTDGNKRTWAFSFIWFLSKADFDFREAITPGWLTALALLIAESNPNDKDKMIGLVLLMLSNK